MKTERTQPIEFRELGSVSAENDPHLERYFVKEWTPYRRAASFENNGFFLLGRTGSGKSAILQKIRLEYEHSNDVIVVHLGPDEFLLSLHQQLPIIRDFSQSTRHPLFAYKILWNLVIAGECLLELRSRGKRVESNRWDHSQNIAYSFLKKSGILSKSKTRMTDKFINLLKAIKPALSAKAGSVELKAELSIAPSETDSNSLLNTLLRDCQEINKQVIPEMLGARSMYILIDDLDLGWSNNEQGNLLLRSLADCLIRFSRIDSTIKPLAAIRTNILNEIGFYQTEKATDYIIECYWDRETVRKVITKRLGVAYGSDEQQSWTLLFDQRVTAYGEKKKETFSVLYERTLGRPRDIIQMVRLCLISAEKRGHKKVTKEDLTEATSEFSSARIRALSEEWKYNYPNLDALFALFARKDNDGDLIVKYSYEELWDVLAEGYTKFDAIDEMNWYYSLIDVDDMTNLIHELYVLGFIGVKSSPRLPITWSHDTKQGSLKISSESIYYIAPCFCAWLDTKTPLF